MKNKLIFSMGLFVILGFKAYSQNKLCVCFSEESEFINIEINKDSTMTTFSIVKKKFADPKKRKKIIDSMRKSSPGHPIDFTIDYFSTHRPKIISLKEEVNCALMVSLKNFRAPNFIFPKGVKKTQIIFLQKINDNKFLKWDAVLALKL